MCNRQRKKINALNPHLFVWIIMTEGGIFYIVSCVPVHIIILVCNAHTLNDDHRHNIRATIGGTRAKNFFSFRVPLFLPWTFYQYFGGLAPSVPLFALLIRQVAQILLLNESPLGLDRVTLNFFLAT